MMIGLFKSNIDGYDLIQVGNYEVSSRAYVGRFNFKGTDQQKLVKELSGEMQVEPDLQYSETRSECVLLDEPSMILMLKHFAPRRGNSFIPRLCPRYISRQWFR